MSEVKDGRLFVMLTSSNKGFVICGVGCFVEVFRVAGYLSCFVGDLRRTTATVSPPRIPFRILWVLGYSLLFATGFCGIGAWIQKLGPEPGSSPILALSPPPVRSSGF